jgi:pilus assembly protein TadC
MNGTFVGIAAGAVAGLGLAVAAAEAFAPAPPDLAAALIRLHPSQRQRSQGAIAETNTSARLGGLVRWLADRLPLPHQNLALVERTVDQFVTSKLVMASYGAALPALVSILLGLMGLPIPAAAVVAVSIAGAALLFFAPDVVLRSQAADVRAEFRRTVCCYFDLVALERNADGGPAEALSRAADVGRGRGFRRINEALTTARLTGASPWHALTALANEVGIDELGDLGDVVALAGQDGAAIADTLAAKAAALRGRQLAEAAAAANVASEKLTLPGVVLAFAFLVLVCYPALARVLGS